jgi:hypothetical protein
MRHTLHSIADVMLRTAELMTEQTLVETWGVAPGTTWLTWRRVFPYYNNYDSAVLQSRMQLFAVEMKEGIRLLWTPAIRVMVEDAPADVVKDARRLALLDPAEFQAVAGSGRLAYWLAYSNSGLVYCVSSGFGHVIGEECTAVMLEHIREDFCLPADQAESLLRRVQVRRHVTKCADRVHPYWSQLADILGYMSLTESK